MIDKIRLRRSFVISVLVHLLIFFLLGISGLLRAGEKKTPASQVDVTIYQNVGDREAAAGKISQNEVNQGSVSQFDTAENFAKQESSLGKTNLAAIKDQGGGDSRGQEKGTAGKGAGGGDGDFAGKTGGDGSSESGAEAAEPARLLTSIVAVYPSVLENQGAEGRTIIGATIAPDGSIEESHVVKSSGYAELDDAALTAFNQSTFSPAKNKQGQAVRWNFQKSYHFTIRG